MNQMQNRYRGCLIGGAAGDALGYAVEFSTESAIFSRYGSAGITEFDLSRQGNRISDDTQMTLFTAAGFLRETGDPIENIWKCYEEWLLTQRQSYPYPNDNFSGLMDIPALWHPRAPGRTCMNAIGGGTPGRIDHPINSSKGCGGVMRAAPAGLISPGSSDLKRIVSGLESDEAEKALDAAVFGAELCALTHCHDLGWLPGAMLGHMVSELVSGAAESIWDAANNAMVAVSYQFADAPDLERFIALMNKAIALALSQTPELEAIHRLGEGWVGDEAMAIALFCTLRHEDSFADGVIAAVNHKGDSDSTGAIAGNLLGAYLGYDAIPGKFLTVELHDEILRIADRLYEKAGKEEEHE